MTNTERLMNSNNTQNQEAELDIDPMVKLIAYLESIVLRDNICNLRMTGDMRDLIVEGLRMQLAIKNMGIDEAHGNDMSGEDEMATTISDSPITTEE